MKVFGLTGQNQELCVTLAEGIVGDLAERGLEVSVLIEGTEGFDLDRPGKDSFEHRRAGAHEVIIGSALRWAQLHERRRKRTPQSRELAGALAADLLILLGFEAEDHPRLTVLEEGEKGRPGDCRDSRVVALAGAAPSARPPTGRPVFGLEAYAEITDFILAFDKSPSPAVCD